MTGEKLSFPILSEKIFKETLSPAIGLAELLRCLGFFGVKRRYEQFQLRGIADQSRCNTQQSGLEVYQVIEFFQGLPVGLAEPDRPLKSGVSVYRLAEGGFDNGGDNLPVFCGGIVGETAPQLLLLKGCRFLFGKLDQESVLYHMPTGAVDFSGHAVTPRRKVFEDGKPRPVKGAAAPDFQIAFIGWWSAIGGRVVEKIQLFLQPGFNFRADDPGEKENSHGSQIADIIKGIAHLLIGQRALTPVGAGFVLSQVNVQQLFHQIAEGESCRKIGKTGGEPGIKDILGSGTGGPLEDCQVLGGVVQDFNNSSVGKELPESLEVFNGEWVDEITIFIRQGYLNEAKLRIIGAFPDKLGIQCNGICLFSPGNQNF